jgi:hypothetical protein
MNVGTEKDTSRLASTTKTRNRKREQSRTEKVIERKDLSRK